MIKFSDNKKYEYSSNLFEPIYKKEVIIDQIIQPDPPLISTEMISIKNLNNH